MEIQKKFRQFFFPSITPKFLIRIAVVALVAYVFFGHICIPLRIQGYSMEPTYHNGSFNFCWRPSYWFSDPKRYDVVLVRFAGSKVMLLKRVVALEGEQVEFQEGKLFINGKELDEPYMKYPCNWNLPSRQVEQGNLYVIGDNRNVPIDTHQFGQTSTIRIRGKILW